MLKTDAAGQMYQFYKENKPNLPSNISTQRDFIIAALCDGQEIAAAFAAAAQNALLLTEAAWAKPKHPKKRKK